MPSYLLLRNNKQSGPLSQDQLLQLGLKPYDLVWIEGKSAAWRYPSEVPELKNYAPIVEEQPYDRFYKKQTEELKEPVHEQQETVAVSINDVYGKTILQTQTLENIDMSSFGKGVYFVNIYSENNFAGTIKFNLIK